MARKDQDPFATDPWADGDDPFQEMLAERSKRGWAAQPGDGSPPTPSGVEADAAARFEPPRRGSRGAGAAIAVAAVFVLVLAGAVVGVITMLAKSAPTSDEAEWTPPPTAVAQEEAFGSEPATPGTLIDGSLTTIVVGEDAAPGVYVAEGARQGQCWWQLEGQLEGVGNPTFLYGEVYTADPLVVLARGFTFSPVGCPDWVAVDPDSAFGGATAQSFAGTATVVGGRDIMPGTYLSQGAEDPALCFARTVDAYAALGGDFGTYAVTTAAGTAVLDVAAGQVVTTSGCGEFERVAVDEVTALDRGEDSFAGEGEFLVGVDVTSGTYGADDPEASCSVTVYPDYRFWYGADAEPVAWYSGADVASMTFEAGQGISAWGCPDFTRRD